MTYDWDGGRTRRIQLAKLIVEGILGLAVPLVITAWFYVA